MTPVALAAAALVVGMATSAVAENTARNTDKVLLSVADVARNLEMADVPSSIDITSDRMEFHYGTGLLRYDGNVHVEHAGATIRADSLEIAFEPDGKRSLKKITARGGVEVLHNDESARGELAEYDPGAATIVLTDQARLGSGPNSLSGAQVVVYLNERRAVVLGRQGVQTTDESGKAAAPAASAGGSGRIRAVFMPDALDRKPGDRK